MFCLGKNNIQRESEEHQKVRLQKLELGWNLKQLTQFLKY